MPWYIIVCRSIVLSAMKMMLSFVSKCPDSSLDLIYCKMAKEGRGTFHISFMSLEQKFRGRGAKRKDSKSMCKRVLE